MSLPGRCKLSEKLYQALGLPQTAQSLDFTCGAACFDSMIKFFRGNSPGELSIAEELGALELGFTPPENIVLLSRKYGFESRLQEGAEISDLFDAFQAKEVVFVTWWDEDAGHYSLIQHIDADYITLMDPWTAREGKDNRLSISYFLENWQARGGKMIRNKPSTNSSALRAL